MSDSEGVDGPTKWYLISFDKTNVSLCSLQLLIVRLADSNETQQALRTGLYSPSPLKRMPSGR
jgi:hypothetical protein